MVPPRNISVVTRKRNTLDPRRLNPRLLRIFSDWIDETTLPTHGEIPDIRKPIKTR